MNNLYAPVIAADKGLVDAANAGNYSAEVSAAGPQLGVLAQQQAAAKANIMRTAAGPGRDAELSQLPIQMAGQTAGALNQGYQTALQGLQGLGTNYGGIGLQAAGGQLSGLQGAGQSYNGIANQQAAGKASTMGLIGSLAGAAGSAAGGGVFGSLAGCWIAEAIYGVDDVRTHVVRAWLNGPFRKYFFGRVIMNTYYLTGRKIAWVARRSRLLRTILKPLFDIALARATR